MRDEMDSGRFHVLTHPSVRFAEPPARGRWEIHTYRAQDDLRRIERYGSPDTAAAERA
jgi:hypothetical protein